MAAFDISLADLSHDIAGVIPTVLVLKWNNHEKSAARHAMLLEPYRVCGTIVSSDSAGLSKLTQRYSLPQAMKLVSEPKELIHAYGRAVGGEAIGVWAADNSQMFYGERIEPNQIVTQMLVAQAKIKALPVQVGMCVHLGECYKIGGGLFGADADFVEQIVEEGTRGGEIVVSGAVHDRLGPRIRREARLREDLAEHGALWSIASCAGEMVAAYGEDFDYPTPFDAAFLAVLRSTSLEDLAQGDFSAYRRTTTVAFVKIAPRARAHLLDAFTEMSLVDLSCRRIASSHGGDVVKSSGALAIVLFEGGNEAIGFARDVIETHRGLGFEARVGVTRGEVFTFPLEGGGRDLAGDPVNIASKLAEDSGLDGVLVEGSVQAGGHTKNGEPFRLTISRVVLSGHRIPV
jgi:class 3 adenylate cyclase